MISTVASIICLPHVADYTCYLMLIFLNKINLIIVVLSFVCFYTNQEKNITIFQSNINRYFLYIAFYIGIVDNIFSLLSFEWIFPLYKRTSSIKPLKWDDGIIL